MRSYGRHEKAAEEQRRLFLAGEGIKVLDDPMLLHFHLLIVNLSQQLQLFQRLSVEHT